MNSIGNSPYIFEISFHHDLRRYGQTNRLTCTLLNLVFIQSFHLKEVQEKLRHFSSSSNSSINNDRNNYLSAANGNLSGNLIPIIVTDYGFKFIRISRSLELPASFRLFTQSSFFLFFFFSFFWEVGWSFLRIQRNRFKSIPRWKYSWV